MAQRAGNCNIGFLERTLSQSWLQYQMEVSNTPRGTFHWRMNYALLPQMHP
jgi:hypothetical protein